VKSLETCLQQTDLRILKEKLCAENKNQEATEITFIPDSITTKSSIQLENNVRRSLRPLSSELVNFQRFIELLFFFSLSFCSSI
jgi:peptidase E